MLNDIADDSAIDEVLQGTDLFKNGSNLEVFKSKIDTDKEFKSYLDSLKDSHLSKGIETWKSNNLEKLIQAEMLKKNPELTPAELKIAELEKKFEEMEKAKNRAEMVAGFKDKFVEKNIPTDLMNFLLDDDKDIVEANITLFENSMKRYIDSEVQKLVRAGAYVPPKANAGTQTITKEQFNKFGYFERLKLSEDNPTLYAELLK